MMKLNCSAYVYMHAIMVTFQMLVYIIFFKNLNDHGLLLCSHWLHSDLVQEIINFLKTVYT